MKRLLLLLIVCGTTAFADYGITKIRKETIPKWIQYSAKANHSDKVNLVAEEPGNIMKINFKNGDTVKKDDIIMVVENRELSIEYAKVKSILSMARTTYEKYQKLYSKKLISEPELFAHKQEFINCKSQYDLVVKRMEDTRIRAKRDGIVGNIDVEIGDYVEAGSIVATTAAKSTMDIIGHLSSTEVNKIKIGSEIAIDFETVDIQAKGVVTEINPFIDEELKKFEIRGKFENKNNYLLDNTYGKVRIDTGEAKGVKIPSSAVLYYDLDTYVYLVKNGKTKRQQIVLGGELLNSYIVDRGIGEGDTIVTQNLYNLTEGQNIQ